MLKAVNKLKRIILMHCKIKAPTTNVSFVVMSMRIREVAWYGTGRRITPEGLCREKLLLPISQRTCRCGRIWAIHVENHLSEQLFIKRIRNMRGSQSI